jgi:NitT/TauT family transport system substrate-binding protein
VVTVFLLHVDGRFRFRPPQPDRDQARRARHGPRTDICDGKPDWVAQRLVDRGFTPRYDYVRQSLDDVSYRNWQEYDPEDSVRFWALRLRELGMIKSSPDKIIAQGTDWRFIKEVRNELGI